MASSRMNVVLQHLLATAEADGGCKTDGELLTRFLSLRDDDAFAALVRRHAPMVWGVCRRLLRGTHDAEDAFQATFLVLVRKAASVVPREMVANWLYGVAYQTAVRSRATLAKRGCREMQMKDVPEPVVAEAPGDDLLPLLDRELSRLPEKFRVLIVLCDLQGKTRKEAARQLGCPEGTVASRHARARGMLAKRLARHGLADSGAAVAAIAPDVALVGVPKAVVCSTIDAAILFAAGRGTAGVISANVAMLTEGVLKTMLLNKLVLVKVAVVMLGLGLAALGAGRIVAGRGSPPADQVSRVVAPDREGDEPPEKEAGPKKAEENPGRATKKKSMTDAEISKALAAPIEFAGFEKGMTLREALDRLEKQFDVRFVIDDTPEGPYDDEIADEPASAAARKLPRALPAMRAPLSRVLRRLLANVGAFVWLIRKDHIEITTDENFRARVGRPSLFGEQLNAGPRPGPAILSPPLGPLVWQDLHKETLRRALAGVAEATDFNVIIDGRVGEKAEIELTARLANVPVDTAVGFLVDMAGLGVVRTDNVFYVTSIENAAKLQVAKKK